MKAAKLTEAQFQKQVLALARLYSWVAYHTGFSLASRPGFPDLVLVHRKHGVVYAELKTDTGTPTPAQAEWLALLTEAGQRAYLWRPKDWACVEATLRGA